MAARRYNMKAREEAMHARRAQILDAAYQLLASVERHPLTVESVARVAGVTRATVHNQFGSRTELIGEVFGDLFRRMKAERIHVTMLHEDPRVALRGMLEESARAWWEQRHVMKRLFSLADVDQELSTLVEHSEHERRKRMAPLVERLVRADVVRANAADEVADRLGALTSYWGFRSIYEGHSRRVVTERFVGLALAVVAAAAPS